MNKEQEAKDISDAINEAREKINKEAGSDVLAYPVKVIFK